MRTVKIGKDQFRVILDELKRTYRVMGPKKDRGTIILSEIDFDDIPAGTTDIQTNACYRFGKEEPGRIFSFSLGPHSFKTILDPPAREVWHFRRRKKGLEISPDPSRDGPTAFVGARACDLAALKLLDKVFLEGPVSEPNYSGRREQLFVLAVNCLHPGGNCFCASMGTGPEAKAGFDLALTEFDDHFLVEAEGRKGQSILDALRWEPAGEGDIEEKKRGISACRAEMRKSMRMTDLPAIIYRNMDHPRWAEIEKRDLECGNCTMVCPTCFCSSSYDLPSLWGMSAGLSEYSGKRLKRWDSCFSHNFARVHGGNFRPSRRARYRHWMTHKLAYWIEQFGRPGCVGCGRCITWCPAGIDITHELEELRRVR